MIDSYKNILLDIVGFITVAYGASNKDVFTTIFGLLLIFIDLNIKLNGVENKIEDLNIKLKKNKNNIQKKK